MDSLVGLLDGPRARGAFVLRSVMEPPWSLRIEDQAPMTVVSIVNGHAWVIPDEAEPERLAAGDVAIMRGPTPYTFKDDPATPVNIIIHPGQVCTTRNGVDLAERMDLGVRTWGNDLEGSTTMLTGTYEAYSEVGDRLLRSLPDLVVIRSGTADLPVVELLNQEIGREEPGQEAVLDRLLDLLTIAVLRAWFARPEADVPAWYLAYGDPIVGPAIRLLQNELARQWTVASLADAVGVSRATLARRFSELVGVPPMTYLTDWRIAVAADLLRQGNLTIGAVASRVGYSSPFALSTAFKRIQGVSPAQYREQAVG
ncbi:MAG: AraC family transcriptional regulator [Acidimicrobiia bacterium]|nr:AraC family transcriptional regulator [Acidimicrobiia bacterium]